MSVSKNSVKAVDLDDLERQLRGITASTTPRTSSQQPPAEDPLAELARIVGRDRSLRAIPGGRDTTAPSSVRMSVGRAAFDGPQPANSPGAQGQFDLRPAYDRAAESVAFEGDAPAEGHDEAFADDGLAYGAEGDGDLAYADDAAFADEAYADTGPADFDAVENVPAMPDAFGRHASGGRRRSSRALALAIPVILVGVGVGAAMGLRMLPKHQAGGPVPMVKAETAPVKVKPAKAPDDQTPSQTALDAAAPATKPSQIVVARPEQPVDVVAAAKAGQPAPAPAPAQPPASTGIVILNGPPAAGAPAPEAPAAPVPVPAAAAPAPAPTPVAAAPVAPAPAAPSPTPVAPAPTPAAAVPPPAAAPQPMPTSAANVPLPTPPRPATPSSVFGTPHKVATLVVKPDGSMTPTTARPDAKPAPKMTDASVDPAPTGTVPPARKPDEAAHPHPAKVKDAAKDADPAPSHRAPREVGAPLSIIAASHRGRPVVASAAPPAAATEATPPAGGSFAIQVASSLSERDAKLTLARMQKQFPSLLSNGSIHRADLGTRGVFYRVQVGGMSREAAEKACAQLKAGGGRCILTRG